MKRIGKVKLFAVLFLVLAFMASVPVQAASYKKLYKEYLEKGVVSYETTNTSATGYGKWVKKTTKSFHKIDGYAVCNLDGKGSPELILCSKIFQGKKPVMKKAYLYFIAYIKGGKVKIAPSVLKGFYSGRNDKVYIYMLPNSQPMDLKKMAYNPKTKALGIQVTESYKENGKTVTYNYSAAVRFAGGKWTEVELGSEESNGALDKSFSKTIKVLANKARNRKKSFK